MSKNVAKVAINIMIIMYSLLVISICISGGILKEEWLIDGHEIKDVCDALRMVVVDDYRGTVAIAVLLLISPVFLYAAFNKFKVWSVNLTLLLFLWVWFWFFLLKYRNCLWF